MEKKIIRIDSKKYILNFIRSMKELRMFQRISADYDSLRTLLSLRDQTSSSQKNNHNLKEINIKFKDKEFHLTLRDYSSDIFILKEIFLDDCYALPAIVNPKKGVILDVGANIGLASLYLSINFPETIIYAFEPFDENYQLLEKNVLFDGSKIKPVKMALSDHSGKSFFVPSSESSNFGGGRVLDTGSIPIDCITLAEFCEMQHIDRINIMKIDCEGSEYAILYSLDKSLLNKIDVIIGEFHGDNALKLLAFLSDYFDIGVNKVYDQPLLIFTAINKLYTADNVFFHQIGHVVDVCGDYFVDVRLTEGQGFALYGPYTLYSPGEYIVSYDIRPGTDCLLEQMIDFCTIDVSTDSGKTVLARKEVTINNMMDKDETTLSFRLERSAILEFRVFSKGKANFMVNTQPTVRKLSDKLI